MTEDISSEQLTLWDCTTQPSDGLGQIYTWNGYSESGNVRSLLRYVDANGEQLRNNYLAWIHDLGKNKIKGKRLIEHLAIDDDISLWWLTLFAEKSAWKAPPLIAAIRIFALEYILKSGLFSNFKLVSNNKNLHNVLGGLCQNLNISYEWVPCKDKTHRWRSIKNLYHALPHSLQALAFLVRYVRKHWPLRRVKEADWFSGENSIFMCSYFIHLNKDACMDGNFYTYLWEDLPRHLHNKNIKINWIQHYLKSSVVPNTDLAVEWMNSFNQSKNDGGCHSFLDSHLSLVVIVNVFKRWVKLVYTGWLLTDIKEAFSPQGMHFNLWPVMKWDWYASIRGSVSMSNLLWLELFDKALSVMPHQNRGLYLCENQAWERALIYAWRKHKHGQLIAVAHSTLRFWDLRYFSDSRTMYSSMSYSMPKPDITVLNGKLAFKAYQNIDYVDNSFLECEALRYGYLNKLQSKSVLDKKDDEPIKILILGDYMPAGTSKMLELLECASSQMQGNFTFTIKPHPNFMVNAKDYPLLNLEVIVNHLGEVLHEFDIAYSGNLTTAAVDSYLAGLPVIVVLDETELNFSPLRGHEGVNFISSSSELATALTNLEWSNNITPDHDEFFSLDPNLTQWKKLLF